MGRFVAWLSRETGLAPLWASGRDTKLLCLQRFVRIFAFGASSLILALFLSQLGYNDKLVGLFMSLTLLGDVFISFLLTLFADAIGRKNILAVGSLLMAASGVVFATSSAFPVLLLAAVVGVIAPSGGEIGPFRAVEESALAQLTSKEHRADVFTWYTLLGSVGASLGQLVSGWVIERLVDQEQWSLLDAYRVTFLVYSVLGLVKLLLTLCLSSAVEARPSASSIEAPARPSAAASTPECDTENTDAPPDAQDDPSRPLLVQRPPAAARRRLLPHISRESRGILAKLCLLFSVDSFASGVVTISWIAVFFSDKFGLASGALGTLFFVTSFVAALSNLVSASLARRIGLIRTMVLTHLPSSIFLALIPVPDSQWGAMALATLRSCTATMDTAPRQAFLAAAVLDSERTAVMGFVNVVRILSQTLGPLTTGALRSTGYFWVSFVLAGSLKSAYDLGMLAMFAGFQARA